MDILSVEIKNFGPIEEAYVNLSDQGLVNIEGENLDDPSANSNGAGKSTLADAIEWCLYGTTARGLKGDEVISEFAKSCQVDAVIQDGEDRYLIQRWRKDKSKPKPSGVALFRNGDEGLVDLSGGTDALTQDKIVTVLGSSREVFTKAVYAGQEALPDLPNMTDKEIKLLVEEASGVEILSGAYKLAQEEAREANQKWRTILDKCGEIQDVIAYEKERLESQRGMVASWEAKQAETLKELQEETRKAALVEVAVQAEVDLLPLYADLKEEEKAIRAEIAAVSGEREEENRLRTALSEAERVATAARTKLRSSLDRMKIEKAAVDGVTSSIGKPCKSCGKPHTEEDISEVRKRAEEKFQEVRAEAVSIKSATEKAIAAEAAALEALLDHQRSMTDLTDAMKRLKAKQDEVEKHNGVTARLARVQEALKAAIEREKTKSKEENPYVTLVKETEKRLEELRAKYDEVDANRLSAERRVREYEQVVKVLGPKGVRAHILDTVTPFLNTRTAHYLGILSDGMIDAVWTTLTTTAKGDLSERFTIEVSRASGGKTFKALSGGQKRKVRLACALALQDLVASRATKPIRLLMLDEVDDALDDSGLERLMTILEEKGREKGTVLVISHNSLKDWVRRTATVTMQGGRSTVSGVLTE